jgi:hypothetical protein
MNKYKVTLGLGRMANHLTQTLLVDAPDEQEAIRKARYNWYFVKEVQDAREAQDTIFNKFLTVSDVEEVA